jgi:hypothetical protein
MGVELRERKWCGVLGIEKVGVEGYWIFFAIGHGLKEKWYIDIRFATTPGTTMFGGYFRNNINIKLKICFLWFCL